jgi:hypothetical protein
LQVDLDVLVEWVREEPRVRRRRETIHVYLSILSIEKNKEGDVKSTSDILVDNIDITDIRPSHMSVVCFLDFLSRLEPTMFGKYRAF